MIPLRYRLRTLLIVVTVLCSFLAFAGWWCNRARLEHEAALVIIQHHGFVLFTRGPTEKPSKFVEWIDSAMGREFRSDVLIAGVADSHSDDDVVAALNRLPSLELVYLAPGEPNRVLALQRKLKDVQVRSTQVWPP